MTLFERAAELRRAVAMARFRVETVVRVGLQTGMHTAMRLPGALLLARELPKGKTSPSLIFKFQARNAPLRAGLVAVGPGTERAWSFLEMDQTIDRIGLALLRLGVRRGESVIMMLKNRGEFLLIQPAIGRLGCAAVSISWRSTPAELEYLVAHSGARAFFFDVDVADVVRHALPRCPSIAADRLIVVGGEAEGFTSYEKLLAAADPAGSAPLEDAGDEAAVITYTSGTTGKPKGAVRKFPKETLAYTLAFIGETPMRTGDVHLAVCPAYHATAFGFIGLSYILGATVVLLEEWKPEAFLAAIERYRVTTTALVPTMLHRVVELGPDVIRKYDLSSLTAIFSGGSALPGPLGIEAMNLLGDKLFNFYGATETGLVTLAKPSDLRASPGTIGRVVPGNEIRLLDERGRVCAAGEVGELFVRSPMLVTGYHADPDATSASMKEGFFSVGDLARQDDRGCYHLEGRKRDMIISGGVNVYPAEIEAVLQEHPDIAEVAVIGVPDREWGERVRAFVVAKPGATPDEAAIKAFCRERLAGPKVPREVAFLPALPRNPTGKVLKRELREL